MLLCEQVVLDENYDPQCLEQPTDIRAISDWPLPGESLVNKAEKPEKMFVILYGEFKPSEFGYKAVASVD